MSAYPLRADMRSVGINVRQVPGADIRDVESSYDPQPGHDRSILRRSFMALAVATRRLSGPTLEGSCKAGGV
jgi:hypothetical protein